MISQLTARVPVALKTYSHRRYFSARADRLQQHLPAFQTGMKMTFGFATNRFAIAVFIAVSMVSVLAQAEDASEALKRAVGLASSGDTKSAQELVRPLAEGGNPQAQHYLAKMLAAGQGMQKDPSAAAEWWHLAAEQNFKEAQFSLGAVYAGGFGIPQDRIEGLKWFILAGAEDGLAYSMLTDVMTASDVEKSRSSAQSWRNAYNHRRLKDALTSDDATKVTVVTELAADSMAAAQYELAEMYRIGLPYAAAVAKRARSKAFDTSSKTSSSLPLGLRRVLNPLDPDGLRDHLQPDSKEAMRLFRLAADQGHVQAQIALASGLETGNGVAVNVAEAFSWYRKAAEQGNSEGQYHLAGMYARGAGIHRDPAEALSLYREAAHQHNILAMRSLGEAYSGGGIFPVDNEQAYMWLLLASISARAEFDEFSAKQTDGLRSTLSEIMSARQIDRAKEAAERCRRTKFRECGEQSFWSWLFGLIGW